MADNNLDKILRDVGSWHVPLEPCHHCEAKAKIKSESLRIALELLPEKKEVKGYNEEAGYSHFATGYNRAIDDVRQAFEDRYGDTK